MKKRCPAASVVIPTLGRHAILERALECLAHQHGPDFEVIVAVDANEREPERVERLLNTMQRRTLIVHGRRPGASAARNAGWRAAESDLVIFIDDDILSGPRLVSEHVGWHRENRDESVGVLGSVRWARELTVTPFMRWLEHGVQFDYPNIRGTEAGWGRLYTANVSLKRSLIEHVDGFEEVRLPFGYEDLDLALRLHERGFRLLYNRRAIAEHLHPMDLAFWKRRVRRIAVAERQFVELHPDFRPYFYDLFRRAAEAPPARGRGQRLAGTVPRWLPFIGTRVWASADMAYRQALAPHFLDAWRRGAAALKTNCAIEPDLDERDPWPPPDRPHSPSRTNT